MLIPFLLAGVGGCGQGGPLSACPDDLILPEELELLGAQADETLFVVRMRTDALSIPEVLHSIKESMRTNGWTIKVDSATDDTGGELQFIKDDSRKCSVFVSLESGPAGDKQRAIKIDIKCDRKNG